MQFVTRRAQGIPANQYPLALSTGVTWHLAEHEQSPRPSTEEPPSLSPNIKLWECQLSLPDIDSEHIIVPSFAFLHDPDIDSPRHRFTLLWQSNRASLQMVPGDADVPSHKANTSEPKSISVHIDCWHSHARIDAPIVVLQTWLEHPPEDYLLVVSVRALELQAAAEPTTNHIKVDVPIELSQLQAQDKIKHRICSPTALTMAISDPAGMPSWGDAIEACFDPITKAYGSWPLAIDWAARNGYLGAVEAIANWTDALRILRAGSPIVCSIRFNTGELQGAPLQSTAGHLVLCYGVEANEVLVKDPAAATHNEVDRRYALDEFIRAWLGRRGGAYIFSSGLR